MIKRLLVAAVVAAASVTALASPPAGAVSDGYWDFQTMAVKGEYRPVVGNFAGDAADDIFWDQATRRRFGTMWEGVKGARGQGAFVQHLFEGPSTVSLGSETQMIVGDFAGDEHDDIFWYGPAGYADYLWTSNGDGTFTSVRKYVSGSFQVLRLRNYQPGGKDDLYLFASSSSAPSYYWRTADDAAGTVTQTQLATYGGRRPVVGDWNGDGYEDVFFHGPGSLSDVQQLVGPAGLGAKKTFAISGSYQPVVIYDVPRDGILFWGPGTAKDAYWKSTTTGFTNVSIPWMDLKGTVTPFPIGAAIITGVGVDDTLFIGADSRPDFYYLAAKGHEMSNQQPLVGDFDGDGWYDIAWYGYGSFSDALWYLEPQSASAAPGTSRNVGAPGRSVIGVLSALLR